MPLIEESPHQPSMDGITSPYGYKKPIPAPPPPSPALGAMRPSPVAMRSMLGKSPSGREFGHQSAPTNLSLSPSCSPGTAASTFLPSGGVPFMPNLVLNQQQQQNDSKSAQQHAMQEERQRRIQKEREESDFSASQLRQVLREERIRMSRIAAELAQLKSSAVSSQLESEVNEEGRINCVLRQLDGVQQEKGRIILELEREEEMLTNTLQKKLDQVKKEKQVLQQQIEREQASHATLESKLQNVQVSGDHREETIEECEDEGEVDDNILPDLAALAEMGEGE